TSTSQQVDLSNVQANQSGTYTAIYVNSCGASTSVSFTITVTVPNITVANGTYKIVDVPGYALDDPNGGGANTGADQVTYSGANQKWTVAAVSGAQYKITAANGLALAGPTASAQLVLQSYTGAANQLWRFQT